MHGNRKGKGFRKSLKEGWSLVGVHLRGNRKGKGFRKSGLIGLKERWSLVGVHLHGNIKGEGFRKSGYKKGWSSGFICVET